MSFGYYKIGAGTPSDICIPISSATAEHARRIRAPLVVTRRARKGIRAVSNLSGMVGAPLVATPGFLKDELRRLQGEALSLGRDISATQKRVCSLPPAADGTARLNLTRDFSTPCGRLNVFIENTWSPFLFELSEFISRHEGFFGRFWGNLYDQIQEYRKRLIGLREVAAGLNVSLTAPAPKLPPPPAIEKIGSFARAVLYIAVAVGAVWIIFKWIIPAFAG